MTLAPPGHEVIADVPCQKCGYNLRSLSTEGRCPECGAAVWPSLSAPPLLEKAYAPWLMRIRRGAWCIIAGYLALLGILPADMLLRGFPVLASAAVHLVLLAIALVLLVAGSVLFSRTEPYSGTIDQTPTVRLFIWVSAAAIPFIVSIVILTVHPLAILGFSVSLLVNQASIVLYVSGLAKRTRARVLARLGLPMVIAVACLWMAGCVCAVASPAMTMFVLLVITSGIPVVFLAWFLIRAPGRGRLDSTPWTQSIIAPAAVAPSPSPRSTTP